MTSDSLLMIAAARACLGTPFHHQGRSPGIGLDCIGLVIVALQALGLNVQDRADYGRRPDGRSLVAALDAHGAVRVEAWRAGDVLLFRYDRQPQHVALATSEDTMIHSFAPAGKVVETLMGDYWLRRLTGVYRFEEAGGSASLVKAADTPASVHLAVEINPRPFGDWVIR